MRKCTLLLIALMICSLLSGQDRISFKSGKTELVKVVEVSDNEIIYKDYSNQDGPQFRVSKDQIEKVVLESGKELIFFHRNKDIEYPNQLTAKFSNLYADENKLSAEFLSKILDDDLYSSYKTGHKYAAIGPWLLVPGALITGYGSYALIAIKTDGTYPKSDEMIAEAIIGVGVPLLATGIVFSLIGKKKIASVAENYNLSFGSTANGVGLALTF